MSRLLLQPGARTAHEVSEPVDDEVVVFRGCINIALFLCAACGQGPTWEPPDQSAVDAGERPEVVEQSLDNPTLATRIVVPRNGQKCTSIGEFAHLEATIESATPVVVTWSFESDGAGCDPVTLATLDAATLHTDAYAMFMWSTACVKDIPNHCGYGVGQVRVHVTDEIGTTVEDSVPFCLQERELAASVTK